MRTLKLSQKKILVGSLIFTLLTPFALSAQIFNSSNSTLPQAQQGASNPAATQNTTAPKPDTTQKTTAPSSKKSYTSLTDIPGLTQNGTNSNMLATLQFIFKWGIAVAVLLAILMTIIGGVQYMTTDAMFAKEEGKHKIQSAIMGLLLALSAWIILYTINPRILEKPDSELLR